MAFSRVLRAGTQPWAAGGLDVPDDCAEPDRRPGRVGRHAAFGRHAEIPAEPTSDPWRSGSNGVAGRPGRLFGCHCTGQLVRCPDLAGGGNLYGRRPDRAEHRCGSVPSGQVRSPDHFPMTPGGLTGWSQRPKAGSDPRLSPSR